MGRFYNKNVFDPSKERCILGFGMLENDAGPKSVLTIFLSDQVEKKPCQAAIGSFLKVAR